MSPPDTNIDRQARRHRWPLIGMALVVCLTGLAFLWWLAAETRSEELPPEASTPYLPASPTAPETETLPARPDADDAETPQPEG